MARISVRRSEAGLVATLTVRPRLANLAVAAAALVLLGTIGLYVVAENWSCWARLRGRC